MPTTRVRHAITETDDVSEALDAAAQRWPEERKNRAVLLRRLIAEGHRSIQTSHAEVLEDRLAAIDQTAGALTGSYGEGYLDDLRADWPE